MHHSISCIVDVYAGALATAIETGVVDWIGSGKDREPIQANDFVHDKI